MGELRETMIRQMPPLERAIARLRAKANAPGFMMAAYQSELNMLVAAMQDISDRLQALEHSNATQTKG